ncbi:unnamed protein product [Brassicogethes aeneus]|uniref:Uncharacterized protein n=1 Tax=Brassicogethes aeneus TaxID=1431903 RepID=A0A9P0ATM9_BRAAE|nr:unnamed protein product [Brassicogethes aeneus]
MLFELESLPHSQATPTIAKRKPQILIEKLSLKKNIGLISKNTNCKITNDPNEQDINGLVLSNLDNGNGIQDNKRGDPQEGEIKLNNYSKDISQTSKQDADSSSTNKRPLGTICINRTNMPGNSSSNISNSCGTVLQKNPNGLERLFVNKSLVPYETEDTSCSDDSSQSIQDAKGPVCVSTNSTVGDWHVTSSTDVAPELTSDEKNWEKKNVSLQIVNDLFKMSHKGYSGPVSSWNGTRSILDKEINNERREERKRTISDSSDQGRSKNLKIASSFKSNPGYNPIQEFHNTKNWSQINGVNNYQSFNKGGGRYRTFPYKKNHKNFRFRQ